MEGPLGEKRMVSVSEWRRKGGREGGRDMLSTVLLWLKCSEGELKLSHGQELLRRKG